MAPVLPRRLPLRRATVLLAGVLALAPLTAAWAEPVDLSASRAYAVGADWHIGAGPDGSMWFTAGGQASPHIGRVTRDGNVDRNVPIPVDSFTKDFVNDADGSVWFDSRDGVSRLAPDGTLTDVATGSVNSLIRGPDGNLWAALERGGVARVTPDGTVTRIPVPGLEPDLTFLDGIAAATDGSLWVVGQYSDQAFVARFGPLGAGIVVAEWPYYQGLPSGVVAGPDGNVWVVRGGGLGGIMRFAPDTTRTDFPGDPGVAAALGPDGAIWYLSTNGSIVRVAPDGTTTNHQPPTYRFYLDLRFASDGALWLSEEGGTLHRYGAIGTFTVTEAVADQTTVRKGTDVTFTARVDPAVPGAQGRLQELWGREWTDLSGGTQPVQADGRFTVTLKQLSLGQRRYRILVPTRAGYAEGVSDTIVVTVTP